MSTKATASLPGSSGARRASSASNSRLTFSSCSTLPQVNERRNDPSVDGARTPPNSDRIAPCRSRSRSSMLSAPPIIPATTQGTFTWGFAPHRRAIRTCSPARSVRPARCASAITGTSPARDTRFGSSNVTWIFARSCNNRTCEVSSRLGTRKIQQLPSSQLRGHLSRRRARMSHYLRGGSRLRRPASQHQPQPTSRDGRHNRLDGHSLTTCYERPQQPAFQRRPDRRQCVPGPQLGPAAWPEAPRRVIWLSAPGPRHGAPPVRPRSQRGSRERLPGHRRRSR
jgi:hypothetical protein